MPKFTVIVPNYNHVHYLKQRIDSILNQTYQDFELILLDDCSTDNSRTVLSQYEKHPKVLKIIYNEVNSGSTFRQWDKGIEIATGEYIWIAESDDLADKFFLETILKNILSDNKIGIAYVHSKLIDSEGIVTFENKQNNSGEKILFSGIDFLKERFLFTNSIGNASSMVFRKDLIRFVKDNSYKRMTYCGDWFFYAQMCNYTHVIEIKQTLNFYRIHDGNVSNQSKKQGKYYTEGFDVFMYIANTYFFKISNCMLNKWAKVYAKDKIKYHYNLVLQKEIMSKFKKYSFTLLIFVFFWSIIYKIKK